MTREDADIVISYIHALEESTQAGLVVERMGKDGYNETEIDSALKALGEIAGRDCGIL